MFPQRRESNGVIDFAPTFCWCVGGNWRVTENYRFIITVPCLGAVCNSSLVSSPRRSSRRLQDGRGMQGSGEEVLRGRQVQSVQADLRYVRRCMLLQVPTPKLFVHICLRTKNEYFLQIPFCQGRFWKFSFSAVTLLSSQRR